MIVSPTSATYDSLLLAYRFMNDAFFNGKLPPCLITLQREKKTFGYFSPNRFTYDKDAKEATDEIALNPQYFRSLGRDDRKVASTLAHEMCHLWQHHHGKPGRGRYHNKEWADKMCSIGLIPSDTGEAGGKDTGDQVTHYIGAAGQFDKIFEKLKGKGFSLDWIEYPPSIQEALATGTIDPTDIAAVLSNGSTAAPRKIDKSKVKYSCPECGINAWAKMGVNLKCGDCDERMIYDDED